MSEHQQSHIQDSTPRAGCPKNLWGHSWKRLDGPGGCNAPAVPLLPPDTRATSRLACIPCEKRRAPTFSS